MHHPFRILDEWVREGRLQLSDPEERVESAECAEERPDGAASDSEAFQAAMADVRALRWNDASERRRVTEEIEPDYPEDEDGEGEGLRFLEAFCREGVVGLEWSREYVEDSVQPLGRLYLDDLRAGRFAVQAHLDLHGLTITAARQELDRFLIEAARKGFSCVRVIHGRGLHSTGRRPLLKEHVVRWLRHRRNSRRVIAFASARAVDGGGGAVYVLLRPD